MDTLIIHLGKYGKSVGTQFYFCLCDHKFIISIFCRRAALLYIWHVKEGILILLRSCWNLRHLSILKTRYFLLFNMITPNTFMCKKNQNNN